MLQTRGVANLLVGVLSNVQPSCLQKCYSMKSESMAISHTHTHTHMYTMHCHT